MNKYLISVDIEGITGVVSKEFTDAKFKQYELGRRYMMSDVNAVIQGVISVDPQASIVVRDAHGDTFNLDLERLHPLASLVQGWGYAMNMLEPLDATYKGVFLVGYHAGGQNNEAVLGHTMRATNHYLKVNNKLLNETGIVALYAGHFNVPVAFISGDNYAVQEAKDQLGEIVGVVVKQSLARNSALSMSLTAAKALLEKAAAEATKNLLAAKVQPMTINPPLNLEMKFYNIGFGMSLYQKLYHVLQFDPLYQFDLENFILRYQAPNALELFQRLNLLEWLLFGLKV
jgi:D-amino peptidase